jgi:hypothetical protein
MAMQLKPQDVVVLVKLLEFGTDRPPLSTIAQQLFLSPSEVHAAIKRSKLARLLHGPESESSGTPNTSNLLEFLVHGLKYAFPVQRGELTRGVPTAYAAAPLKKLIRHGNDPPPVWPFEQGKVRGYAFMPLYKNVPQAALRDGYLYEVLALIDAIRDGRARERQFAEEELIVRLREPRHAKPID